MTSFDPGGAALWCTPRGCPLARRCVVQGPCPPLWGRQSRREAEGWGRGWFPAPLEDPEGPEWVFVPRNVLPPRDEAPRGRSRGHCPPVPVLGKQQSLQTYLISASDEGGLHGGCSGSLAGTPPGPVRQDTLPRCSSGLWGSNESCAPPPPPHAQLRPQRCAQTPADRPWDSRAPASAGRTSCAVVEKVGIQSLNMLWSVIS